MLRLSALAVALGILLPLSLVSAGSAQANPKPSTRQYSTTLVSLLARPGGKPLGQITPATPVTVLKAHGPDVQVTFDGWTPKGYFTIAFQAPGQHIVDARLDKGARRKVIATTTDAYGDVWQHIQLSGWLPKSALTPHVDNVWTIARKLYSRKCSQCHSLHAPSEFTANQWPSVLHVMARRAALNARQHALIRKYLQMHARDMTRKQHSHDTQSPKT